MTVDAPWTPEQVAHIVAWQGAGWVHPLTCVDSEHGALAVFGGALACLTCGYVQTWVPNVVAEHGPPPDPRELFGRDIKQDDRIHVLATFGSQQELLAAMLYAISWVKLDEQGALRALKKPDDA